MLLVGYKKYEIFVVIITDLKIESYALKRKIAGLALEAAW